MKQDPYLGPKYRARERFGDYLGGWSDGRRLPEAARLATPIKSAKLNQIAADHGRRIETLRVALTEELQPLQAELAEIERQLTESQRLVDELTQRLTECKLEGVRPERRHGEDNLTDGFIVTRRQREYDAELIRLRADINAGHAEQVTLATTRDGVVTRIRALDEKKNAQLRRLDALHDRRRATYLRGVTRTHGDRIALSDFSDSTPTWNAPAVAS